jgi:tryptophan synthase alpha chain
MSIRKLFEQLTSVRAEIHIPLIMMGYLNPVMQFGFEAFCKECHRVGVDGMIIPDLLMADFLAEYKEIATRYGLEFIFLITPETSEARIREIDSHTNGFIYMVSSAATTGTQTSFDNKVEYFNRINGMNLKNPRLIGFGISNKSTRDMVNRYSSGAIIGSAFIKALEETQDVEKGVKMLLENLEK